MEDAVNVEFFFILICLYFAYILIIFCVNFRSFDLFVNCFFGSIDLSFYLELINFNYDMNHVIRTFFNPMKYKV